ncbi:MAG TPA: biosynthetic arginine decarboxylase, partial [Planctomycetota bacterium]|nr:biosynthetic arginine decarboxylase [Planctomycetota bacterium]
KFGLTITELLECVRVLRENDLQSGFRLLHFHLGSQITNIHAIKNAITEVARIYAELRPEHPGLELLDVGGGLGIDYDGSQTNFESSINYTLEEYARDVIFRVKAVCDEAEVPHPTIVTESGRATVAYHSVLVVNVLGVASGVHEASIPENEAPPSEDEPQGLTDLREIAREISEKNVLESYHDAVQTYEDLLHSFKLGFLTLEQRSQAERLYNKVSQRILKIVKRLDYVPEELEGIEDQLADTYFCNFSIFQSLPDSWAIQQLFPILPIHRLTEQPRNPGILADITCDSDGRIDRFIDLRDVNRTLPLHDFDGGNYYLGFFLVGAYQEILGDLHNLFGDTNSVHISLDENGEPLIETVVTGDTVQEVLAYVQYSATELVAQVRKDIEAALRAGRITLEEARRFSRSYETGLRSYTYLRRRQDHLADQL